MYWRRTLENPAVVWEQKQRDAKGKPGENPHWGQASAHRASTENGNQFSSVRKAFRFADSDKSGHPITTSFVRSSVITALK